MRREAQRHFLWCIGPMARCSRESEHRSSLPFAIYTMMVTLTLSSGLSPSSDTAYYQFLLKLGVIRAPTWGERWDIWKATNTISTRKHTSPRKARDVATRPTSAAIKARLPFLASASSDLDEGFDGDGESVVNDVERPSPRKQLWQDQTKSIVGHSPTASIDYDFITLDTPVRTSTPIRARGKSPPLPPYTESDLSMSSRPEEDQDGPSTPRARPQTLDPEENDMDEDVLWEMERRADEFYETGLRGRCWDVWAAASDWVQVSYILYRSRLQTTPADLQENDDSDRHRPIQYPASSDSGQVEEHPSSSPRPARYRRRSSRASPQVSGPESMAPSPQGCRSRDPSR